MAEQQHTGNPGNFAEDREKASRAGHIGGQHSSGNFANDREKAVEAGRKGGQASHGATGGSPSGSPSGSQSANAGQSHQGEGRGAHQDGQLGTSHSASTHSGSGKTDSGHSASGKGAEHRPGNFAEDREKASAAGHKGGQSSHGSR